MRETFREKTYVHSLLGFFYVDTVNGAVSFNHSEDRPVYY
jgi:hypothetical protein